MVELWTILNFFFLPLHKKGTAVEENLIKSKLNSFLRFIPRSFLQLKSNLDIRNGWFACKAHAKFLFANLSCSSAWASCKKGYSILERKIDLNYRFDKSNWLILENVIFQTHLLADMNESPSTSSSSSSSLSSKSLSMFSSPFKRKPKGPKAKSKNKDSSETTTFQRLLLSEAEETTPTPQQTTYATATNVPTTQASYYGTSTSTGTNLTKEELLRLFILKLDEEANYFQVSASPEEELCDCQKCQVRWRKCFL